MGGRQGGREREREDRKRDKGSYQFQLLVRSQFKGSLFVAD